MKKATTKTEENAQKSTEGIVGVNTAMEFVNKLIVNGEEVADTPKKVNATVNGKNVDLKCKLIPDDSIASAYRNSFTVPVNNRTVQVFYAKGGGVLCGSIYIDGKLEFSGISMQGVFSIIEACFSINKVVVDKLYIASNTNRKKPPEPAPKVEVKEAVAQ